MIVGVGIDASSAKRLKATSGRSSRFTKVFNLFHSSSKTEKLSNFSIIEAFFKSLGCPNYFNPKDLRILRENGAPKLVLYGALKNKLIHKKIHISVTHLNDIIIAIVIVEDEDEDEDYRR